MRLYEINKLKFNNDKNKAYIVTTIQQHIESAIKVLKRDEYIDNMTITLKIDNPYYELNYEEIIKCK
jgi:hypothetical protein